MGRRNEGEATFEADGQTWRMRFDFNAMADFEEETGQNALAVLQAMEAGKVSAIHIRALFYAALREHHPDITLRQAGRLVASGMEAFETAISSSMPTPQEGDIASEKTKAATRPAA
jgi:hypothetical protein